MDAKQGWQEAVPAMLAGKQRPGALKLLTSPKSWGWKRDFCTGSVRSPDPDPDACHPLTHQLRATAVTPLGQLCENPEAVAKAFIFHLDKMGRWRKRARVRTHRAVKPRSALQVSSRGRNQTGGAPSVSWLLRKDQRDDPRVHLSSCRNSTRQSCSTLIVRKVTANDTGYFTCIHDDSPSNKDLMAKIYVFVRDDRNPFVEIHPEHPQIIYISDETKTVVVPCRVTSPDIKTKLIQEPPAASPGPRRGKVAACFALSGNFIALCGAKVAASHAERKRGGRRGGEGRVQNLALKANSKKLLVGETLNLECTAETFINGRIELVWTCPNGRRPYPRRKIDQSETVYKVGSILMIQNVTMQDGGMYTCKTFDVPRLEANVTVTVYGRQLLWLCVSRQGRQPWVTVYPL
ncbi:Vascular endothelial growth factor receptor 1 [Anas platyrhynchos]|uniref:Platelet-derived growth factor receptor-like protein n=1 Tax=Anas platyrhynchos TaxID=8839 RepID=R0LFI7_ANAPL|nr:Vascular endothelial growth factor receptor 1 [Anas platyrhynchos]